MKWFSLLFVSVYLVGCKSAKPETQSRSEEAIVSSIPTNDSISKNDLESRRIPTDSIATETNIHIEQASALKQAENTHLIWNALLKTYVSKQGNVDYKGFKKKQAELANYLKSLDATLPNNTHTKAYTLAYWINAYNAFTVDLILRNYPIKSIKDIKNPWQQRHWKLGSKWYNLDEIEHQILRKMDEPRIHFAIVCASISCPKLLNEAYTSENLEQQLTNATQDFLSDTNKNSISKDKLELSKIFKWFNSDFTKNGSLIDFLNLYLPIEISKTASKSFKDYNWDLNE